MDPRILRALKDPDRLLALRATGLMDTPPDPAFDRWTRLVRTLLSVDIALITFVARDRQFILSADGLSGPWARDRETPISYSFCKYAVADRRPVVVRDTREDPRFRDNPSVYEKGLIAYAGIPLRGGQGQLLGALDAIHRTPRDWSDRDVAVLRDLAAGVTAQIELQVIRHRMQAITQNVSDLVSIFDEEGRAMYHSPSLWAVLGREPDERIGDSVRDLVHPDDRDRVERAAQEVLRDPDETVLTRIRVRHADGSYRLLDARLRNLLDDPAVRGILSVARDVTAEEAARDRLQQTERRYQRLVENAPVGIFRTTPEGAVLTVNATMARILGFDSIDEAVTSFEAVSRQLFEDPGRGGELLRLVRRHGHATGFEYQLLRRDGEPIWLEINARTTSDDGDEPPEVEGFARDVTSRRHAESELRRQQTMLQRTERIAHVGSWELDVATGEVAWSAELYRIFQRDPGRAPPSLEEWLTLFVAEDRETIASAGGRALETGEPYDLELRAVRADGEIRDVRARAVPERGPSGDVVRLFGSLEDVTDYKRRQAREAELLQQLAQAQKIESVGRLAGGVAHDFNNMLSVILGHVQLAREHGQLADAVSDDLEEIRRAAASSADLTRQLLAFAREQVASPRVLDINETIESTLRMLRRLIGEEIELVWRPGRRIGSVRIDPAQVDQILANLVVNARDAISDVGRITIETAAMTVGTEHGDLPAEAEPGEYVVLSVSDTGGGIAEASLPRIFEPFYTTKPTGEGTGLGLATVYGVVRQNDGFIDVRSRLGEGTTFRIFLPRAEGEPAPRGPAATAYGTAVRGDETILVVEDQPAVLKLATRMLDRLGYTVLPAPSPEDAIRIAREQEGRIHLLVTDVMMPGMNGRDLAYRLSATDPGLKVLFMSGHAEDIVVKRGAVEEGIHFLPKPFEVRELALKVRETLDAG